MEPLEPLEQHTAYRTCPLCEATCGVEMTLDGRTLLQVRGDKDDVFSKGYLCPKALALVDLENDPDRVSTPLIRDGSGFKEATWDEAFEHIDAKLAPILREHGADAVALYIGNPNAHNLAGLLYGRVLTRVLGTRNVYTASTVDQMPKHVSSGLMFGTLFSIPIPDVDRTQYMLMLGANPFASNGSLFTAPNLPGRLRDLRKRGGRLVVVDPRRSRTAKEADEHVFIVPGTDAHLLFGIVHTLFAENLDKPGRLLDHLTGIDEVRALAEPFTPEAVAGITGVPAGVTRRIAREMANAESAVVYGRIGTCTQEFGALSSWLVDVINVLTGNLDRPGGAMFTKPAAGGFTTGGTSGSGRGVRFGRRRSRVHDFPEIYGELPSAHLADEITTPGEGQVRALITIAGNPAVSTPNAGALDQALSKLDFMVSVDIYRNETTRHADVILPGESVLTKSQYDIAFYQLSCRNVTKFSPAVLPLEDGALHEWEAVTRLAGVAAGQGPNGDVQAFDDMLARETLQRSLQSPASPAHGVDMDEAWSAVAHRRGPDRILDILLRTGPYGDAFGRNPDGLTLDVLEAHPHGIDLGPLEPRIPEVLRTPSGKIELAPEPLVADVARLRASLSRKRNGGIVLVGRRQLRSNNSWMHNLPVLAGGTNTCTMHIHPDDAERLRVEDGKLARVTSQAGSVDVVAEVTDAIMPGVVSIPHGWGHDADGSVQGVAATNPGVNSNVLTPPEIDPVSGNAILSGIPVSISAL